MYGNRDIQLDLYTKLVFTAIAFMRRCRQIERHLLELDAALDNWIRCVITLEAFCDGIVVELERIRQNVNIASIVGSSVGFIGASLALAGVITAPFTFGASLGLTIAGGVIGGMGGITSVGSKFTEVAMNRKPIEQLQRRQQVLKERSDQLRLSLEQLKECVEGLFTDVDPPTLDDLHTIEAQAMPGLLRMIKAFTILPVMVIRSASRVAIICAAVIGPLSAALDVGIVAFSAYNLATGSRTQITENLRAVSVLLRAMRTQMQIWRFGSERWTSKEDDVQDVAQSTE